MFAPNQRTIAELPVRATPQVLRRTFNTLLLEAGVSEVVLRAQMGHTTRAMTERYAGVHIGRKQDAVEALLDAMPNAFQPARKSRKKAVKRTQNG